MKITKIEFKVSLRNFTEVDTYRIFTVDTLTSLAEFGIAIVLSFNGDCSHLLEFRSGKQRYAIYEDGYSKDVLSAFDHGITELNEKSILYYDFGDSWEFDIELIRVYDQSDDFGHPEVTEGNGLGIIEDIGGYTGLLKAYKKSPRKFGKFDVIEANQKIENNVDQIKNERYNHSGFNTNNISN